MAKQNILSIKVKNDIIDNIINAIISRKCFLLCGHKSPDEDCISSMVAFAILLTKFDRMVKIYIKDNIPENIKYLLNICKYNSIKVLNKNNKIKDNFDTIAIFDTPKRSMLDINKKIEGLMKDKKVLKMEIDHHLESDSDYSGDEGYNLVTEASSASELVGFIALKLRHRKELLGKYLIADPFSRNFVLAILTGIISDTNMGKFLKTRKSKRYYNIFSKIYNDILMRTTVRESNFTKIDEVYNELQKLSEKEGRCYSYIIKKKVITDSIGYAILHEDDMEILYNDFDNDTLISATKTIANELAEESGKVGIIVYYEKKDNSNLLQFRVRRSQDYKVYDLREVLKIFSIPDGGGHEGAIAFRFPADQITDVDGYVAKLVDRLKNEIKIAR